MYFIDFRNESGRGGYLMKGGYYQGILWVEILVRNVKLQKILLHNSLNI